MFEFFPDYRKIVSLYFSIRSDDDLIKECGFLKKYINFLSKKFETI